MNLINDDCLVSLKSIPDNSVNLIIIDPPYGINYKDWDKIDDFWGFTESWLNECYRVLSPNGTMWVFWGPTTIRQFMDLIDKTPFINRLENWSIWARQKGRGSERKLKSVREDCLHLTKSETFVWNKVKLLREVIVPYMKDGRPRGWFIDQTDGLRKRWTGLGNVWCYSSAFWKSKSDPQIHPAQKPIMMLQRLVLLSSNSGDLILDPFMGSGSTGISCKLLNRNFIGIEKDPNIFLKAKNWIENINFDNYKEFINDV